VIYMRQVDGWGGDHWGARGLAGAEAVVGGIGGLALLVFFLVRKPAATHIPTASISSGAAEPLD
jgi:PAT family beta-lactamase induction signal transducer AmpG